jgi:hypothetical protein
MGVPKNNMNTEQQNKQLGDYMEIFCKSLFDHIKRTVAKCIYYMIIRQYG